MPQDWQDDMQDDTFWADWRASKGGGAAVASAHGDRISAEEYVNQHAGSRQLSPQEVAQLLSQWAKEQGGQKFAEGDPPLGDEHWEALAPPPPPAVPTRRQPQPGHYVMLPDGGTGVIERVAPRSRRVSVQRHDSDTGLEQAGYADLLDPKTGKPAYDFDDGHPDDPPPGYSS